MASSRSFHRWLPILSGESRGLLASGQRAILWPLSYVYRLGVGKRNRRFDRGEGVRQVAVPVISVGNITTGGTGKTPMVQWVCQFLRQRSLRVALISRGYGSQDGAVNDEALELELVLPDVPHLQDPDRFQVASIAVEELESQIIVMDDGFQHRRLHRDLDWVLIDATNPFGFGYCLPRGLLREPLSGLKRADAIILTRCDQVDAEELLEIQKTLRQWVSPETPIATSIHQPCQCVNSGGKSLSLQQLSEQPAVAIAGIGNPDAFYQTLREQGVELLETRNFPDHHAYQRDDIESLRGWLQSWKQKHPQLRLLTTRKDLVKLGVQQLAGVPVWALEIQIQFLSGQESLEQQLDDCCRGCPEDLW